MSKIYNVLVPRIDFSGPVRLAIDLAQTASESGFQVNIYYLNGDYRHENLGFKANVKKLKLNNLFQIKNNLHSHCMRPDIINAIISIFKKNFISLTTIPSHVYDDIKYDYSKWKVNFFYFFWKIAISKLNHRVVITQTMMDYYQRELPKLKFNLIYHSRRIGIKPAEDKKITQKINELKKKYTNLLCFIGGITERKNISALANMLKNNNKTCLIIFGDGPNKDQILDIEKNSKNIVYFGYNKNPFIYLSEVDSLILPSYAEGLPTVILEAKEMDKLTLMSDIEPHKELEKLKFGLTFNHIDFSNLEDKINQVKKLSSDINFIEESNQLYKAKFNPKVNFHSYEKLI
tara:strand:- start:11586 stop:12623 length:1038 start_codon:yes stop_codon:yes gene_type:complete